MRVPNLYIDQPLQSGSRIELPEAAHQHLIRVLRMSIGQQVRLFNNSGNFYTAQLIDVGKRASSLEVLSSEPAKSESRLHTHLGQVVSRGDRMDFVIQKSTELGVTEITPLVSERCEVRLNQERGDKRLAHWQQIAINAAEQSGRSAVPIVHPVVHMDDWIARQPTSSTRLVLHHRDTQQLTAIAPAPTQISLLIGPEGGLTEPEIERARAAGFLATTLGPRVLRTETAPITALSIVQWLWGDLKNSDEGQNE